MPSNLPPIDLSDDKEKYAAHSFEQKIEFTRCSHKQAVYNREKGELRCPCGVAFSGPRLGELAKALGIE